MPTGATLKERIAKMLAFSVQMGTLAGGDSLVRDALIELAKRKGGGLITHIDEYIRTAQLIGSAMPQAPSIDNFIDSHRDSAVVAECGKLAIAAAILEAERKSLLYVDPERNRNRLDFNRVANTWLNALFQLVTLNAQKGDLPTRLRKVRIVSFNYDRCIEHFMHHAIQNYYRLGQDESAALLQNLQVIHPYGTIGSLPWQGASMSLPYGSDTSASKVLQVSQGLRTFTEGTDVDTSEIGVIRHSVWHAQRLVFLGFAFHELNMQVLFETKNDSPVRGDKLVFGSAYGLSDSDKEAIAQEIAALGRYGRDQVTLRRDLTAAKILPEYSRSLKI